MANSVRKNTVKLVFGPGVKIPSNLDVLKFTMDNLKLSATDMHSIYKDENGGQFYVKLIDEETFAAFIADTDEVYNFKFEDGSIERVRIEQASRIFRYVRIFNLPPEIEDSAIQYVLGQYGTIRQHVRERFPSEMKVDIFNGVRGVHMEVSKEIPANLYVGHFRARIFYDGLKNKCFFCKAEGHVKQNCPKLAAVSSGSGNSTKSPGAAPLGRPVKPVIEKTKPMTLDLTVLKLKTSVLTNTTAMQQQVTTTQQPCASITSTPTETPQETPSASSSNITSTETSTQQQGTITQQPGTSIALTPTGAQQQATNTQPPGTSIALTPNETSREAPSASSLNITNTTKQADPATVTSGAEVAIVAQSRNINGTTTDQHTDMDTEVSEADRQKMMKRTLSSSPDGSGGEGVQLRGRVRREGRLHQQRTPNRLGSLL